eukprot:TRINITY_DN36725_c0_g1_i1.p1 TRINITY_DN36725_c0_g1~~TRINITY_DN36725_c0_g1_i1.p1  ORF type:complete len:398 (+),score=32.56 TRINITY_DN36725_c0_g1_i1:67-1260(+)
MSAFQKPKYPATSGSGSVALCDQTSASTAHDMSVDSCTTNETEEGDVEACCICLDWLHVAPVSILLDANAEPFVRACPHIVHTSCANMLCPAKCPLCRKEFQSTSEPICRETFGEISSDEFLLTMRRLDGETALVNQLPTAKVDSVVQLFAAVLPITKVSLQKAFDRTDEWSEVASPDLQRFFGNLQSFGVEARSFRVGGGRDGTVGVRGRRPMVARLRWFAVKVAEGTGTGIHVAVFGAVIGTLVGGAISVPWLDESNDTQNDMDLVAAIMFVVFIVRAIVFIVYFGIQRVDIVLTGCGWGVSLGFALGLLHSCITVNPDNLGCRKAFCAGLRGESFRNSIMRCAARCGCARRAQHERPTTDVQIFHNRVSFYRSMAASSDCRGLGSMSTNAVAGP